MAAPHTRRHRATGVPGRWRRPRHPPPIVLLPAPLHTPAGWSRVTAAPLATPRAGSLRAGRGRRRGHAAPPHATEEADEHAPTRPDRPRHPGLRRRDGRRGAWQRRHPAPPGTTRAATTRWPTPSRASPWASAAWSHRSCRPACLDPVTPGRGRHAKVLDGHRRGGLGGHHRRRRRPPPPRTGGLPDAGTLPAADRVRRAPARMPCRAFATPRSPAGSPAPPPRPRSRRPRSRWRRPGRRRRAGRGSSPARGATSAPGGPPSRRHPGLGRHLLLEPPPQAREPLAVGHARRAPLERALQPLDRAAPAGRRGPHDERALRPARPGRGAAERHRGRPRRQPASTSSGSTPRRSGRSAGSRTCSTRPRTTGCTTAATGSTSTATTAAS